MNARGEILFFEANATMVVYPPVLDPKWAYRRPAVEAVLAAVRAMLVTHAKAGPEAPNTSGPPRKKYQGNSGRFERSL